MRVTKFSTAPLRTRSMLVPAWPPGPPLAIPTTTALVLTLPAAAADEDESNVSSPPKTLTAARVSAVVAPSGTVVHVLVVPDGADATEVHVAESVFDQLCSGSSPGKQLTPRQLCVDIDELRTSLWMCTRFLNTPEDAPSVSTLLGCKRGFERLTAACDSDDILDDDFLGTYYAHVPQSAPWSSLPDLPMLQTPQIPSSPPAPGTGKLARHRSVNNGTLAPLNFASLRDLNSRTTTSEGSSPRAASRFATAALSCVRSHLFLGGSTAAALPASTLQAKRITTIINLAPGAVPNSHSSGFEYLTFHAHDSEDEDLSAVLPDIIDAISRAKMKGEAALVHCHRGVSRSAAAAAAALMLEEGIGCAKALKEVRCARPVSGPNPGFVQTLQGLEETAEGHGRRRVTALGPLRNNRADGGGQEVLREAQGEEADDPFAVLVLERGKGKGVIVARGPLAHWRRWRRGLWLANWIEQRDESCARRAGRQIPPRLRTVALHADSEDAREVRNALVQRRLSATTTA